MSYIEYLKDVLRPLHIYDLDNGYGADEIYVLGTALNEVFNELEATLREMSPLTAENYGLEIYENVLPYKPLSENLADRRAAVAALTSISGFTVEELNRSLRGSGIEATVSECGEETVCVYFPTASDASADIEELKQRVELILPCHLDVIYDISHVTWLQFNQEAFQWERIEDEELTWMMLQNYEVD